MEIRCPITNEVIINTSKNGLVQRSNYSEIWFKLSDGSRMRVAVSKNAKNNLTEKQADEIFNEIQKGRINRLKSKALKIKVKEKQLKRINGTKVEAILDKANILINKKK